MPSKIAAKVAARFAAQTDFFKPGDPIVFGKYKNKHGIIVRVFNDEKGHPSIEIQPIPKGRKKNKVMGLYKIWHDPNPPQPEEAAKTAGDDHDFDDDDDDDDDVKTAAGKLLEKAAGKFNLFYLPQHADSVDGTSKLLLEAERMFEQKGLPLKHTISVVLHGGGLGRHVAVYHPGSSPPTIQVAPKSYKDVNLLHTLIHELGHYYHDDVVPDGMHNPEIQQRFVWAMRQKRTQEGGAVDVLTRRAKALDKRYFELQEEKYIRKPLPRKEQPFEFDQWINGTQYHVKGKIVGKRGKEVLVEIIDAPEKYLLFQRVYRRGAGPLVVPVDVFSLTFVSVDPAKERELAEVEKERTEVYAALKALKDKPDDRYEVQHNDWVPTTYSRTNSVEWFAELITTYVLGHLKSEPAEWLLSVVKTGKAPADVGATQ